MDKEPSGYRVMHDLSIQKWKDIIALQFIGGLDQGLSAVQVTMERLHGLCRMENSADVMSSTYLSKKRCIWEGK